MATTIEFKATQTDVNLQRASGYKSFDIDALNKKKLLTRHEAAFYIGVCPATMHTIIHNDDFPALARIGGRVFVNRMVLDQWIDEQTGKKGV